MGTVEWGDDRARFGGRRHVRPGCEAKPRQHPADQRAKVRDGKSIADISSAWYGCVSIQSVIIKTVCKSQSCMVSKLRIIWKQTVEGRQAAAINHLAGQPHADRNCSTSVFVAAYGIWFMKSE